MSQQKHGAVEGVFDAGAVSTVKGPAEIYSGDVYVNRLALAEEPGVLGVYRVLFMPGTRTVWHAHPMGQVLHATMGVGEFQREGEDVVTLMPGDTVLIKPNERHWHGAASDQAFVHIAVNADRNPQWFEPVQR